MSDSCYPSSCCPSSCCPGSCCPSRGSKVAARLVVGLVAVVSVVVVSTVPNVVAEPDSRGARSAAIATTLNALRSYPQRDTLRAALYAALQKDCAKYATTQTLACLHRAARVSCSSAASCFRVADVIITNLMAENHWLPRQQRVRLLDDPRGYRVARDEALIRAYAQLVVTLPAGARTSPETLARNIDSLCMRHDQAGRHPWQRCVAGMLWYISHRESGV